MMQHRFSSVQAAALLGLATLLVGCGTDGTPGEYDPYLVSSYSEAPQEIIPEHSWEREQDLLRHNLIQEEIAACMAAQGFDYVPTAYVEPEWYLDSQAAGAISDVSSAGSVEYAQQHGYRVTEFYRTDRQVTEPPELDPENRDVRAALSPQEQLAFDATLYGPGVLWTQEQWDEYLGNLDEFGNWSGAGADPLARDEGCIDAATAAHPEPQRDLSLFEDPDYQALQAALDEKRAVAASDPRYVELELEWSQCMSEAGYHFTHQYEPREAIQEKYLTLGTYYDEQVALVPYDAPDYEEQLRAIFALPLPGIAELQEEEFATAIADAKCVAAVN